MKLLKILLFFLIACPAFAQDNVDAILLSKKLKNITDMPYICNGYYMNETGDTIREGCGNAAYWDIVKQKDDVIQLLIDILTDTTQTKAVVPLFGWNYTVADIAYTALREIIHGIPTFKLLGIKFDKKGCGYCSYWYHLTENFDNRVKFQQAVQKWYDKNAHRLIWIEGNEVETGEGFLNHPAGGYFIVSSKKGRRITFESNYNAAPTGLNERKFYYLKKAAVKADFNYAKLNNNPVKADFEPVDGKYKYYQFIATFKGLSYNEDAEDDSIKDFHDILIIKTDNKNKILDAYQHTLEWAEWPSQFDVYRYNTKNVILKNNLDINWLNLKQTIDPYKTQNEIGIVKFDINPFYPQEILNGRTLQTLYNTYCIDCKPDKKTKNNDVAGFFPPPLLHHIKELKDFTCEKKYNIPDSVFLSLYPLNADSIVVMIPDAYCDSFDNYKTLFKMTEKEIADFAGLLFNYDFITKDYNCIITTITIRGEKRADIMLQFHHKDKINQLSLYFDEEPQIRFEDTFDEAFGINWRTNCKDWYSKLKSFFYENYNYKIQECWEKGYDNPAIIIPIPIPVKPDIKTESK